MKKILLMGLLLTSMSFAQTSVEQTLNKAEDLTSTLKKIEENTNTLKNFKVQPTGAEKAGNTLVNGIGTVYQDSKTLTGTVYNDFKDAAKHITPKIESAIQEIAKGLKTSAVAVWDILVRQQLVWSWCYLIGMIVSLLVWFKFYRTIKEAKTDLNEFGNWKVNNILMTIGLLFSGVFLSILSFQHLEAMMTGFINPEFGAIRTVIEMAKTLK